MDKDGSGAIEFTEFVDFTIEWVTSKMTGNPQSKCTVGRTVLGGGRMCGSVPLY